jgi:hypothetical protein
MEIVVTIIEIIALSHLSGGNRHYALLRYSQKSSLHHFLYNKKKPQGSRLSDF